MMEPSDTPEHSTTETASSGLFVALSTRDADAYLYNAAHSDHNDLKAHQFAPTDENFLSLLPPTIPAEQQKPMLPLAEAQDGDESITSLVLNWSNLDNDHDDDIRIVQGNAEVSGSGMTSEDGAVRDAETAKKITFCPMEDSATTATTATTAFSDKIRGEQSPACRDDTAAEEDQGKTVSFIEWILPSHSSCSALTVLDSLWESGTAETATTTSPVAVGDEASAKAHALLQEVSGCQDEEGDETRTSLTKTSTAPTATTTSPPLPSRSTLQRRFSKRASFLFPLESVPSSFQKSSSSFRNLTRGLSRRGSEFAPWESIALSQADLAFDLERDESDNHSRDSSESPTGAFVTNRGVWRSSFTGVGKVPSSRVRVKPRDLSWTDSGSGRRVATQATRRRW